MIISKNVNISAPFRLKMSRLEHPIVDLFYWHLLICCNVNNVTSQNDGVGSCFLTVVDVSKTPDQDHKLSKVHNAYCILVCFQVPAILHFLTLERKTLLEFPSCFSFCFVLSRLTYWGICGRVHMSFLMPVQLVSSRIKWGLKHIPNKHRDWHTSRLLFLLHLRIWILTVKFPQHIIKTQFVFNEG